MHTLFSVSKEPYRRRFSHEFHLRLFEVLDTKLQHPDYSKIDMILSKMTKEDFIEVSRSAHSHLADVLTLPYKCIDDKQLASDISFTLFLKLIEYAKKESAQGFLLICKNNSGFAPLQIILMHGLPINVTSYLDALNDAKKENAISAEQYKEVFCNPNKAGFTPLYTLLSSENADENIRLYFNQVLWEMHMGTILPIDYAKLLMSPTSTGFTPLHQAFNSNIKTAKIFLEHMRKAIRDKIITGKQYAEEFLKVTNDGFTVLHIAISTKDPDILALFLKEIDDLRMSDLINGQEYVSLLQKQNKFGYTPLLQAINTKNKLVFNLYFGRLKDAKDQEVIGNEEFKRLLTKSNDAKFTPLLQVATNSDGEFLEYFFKILEKHLTQEELLEAFGIINTDDRVPFCKDIKGINNYLEHKHKELLLSTAAKTICRPL